MKSAVIKNVAPDDLPFARALKVPGFNVRSRGRGPRGPGCRYYQSLPARLASRFSVYYDCADTNPHGDRLFYEAQGFDVMRGKLRVRQVAS